MVDPIAIATALADEVLFPAAIDTDGSALVPLENLDALAAAGLYGLFAPIAVGGLDSDSRTTFDTVEAVASGCLSTALVWIQHFGLLGSLLDAPAPLRDAWLADATAGRRRGGIAWAGLRPGPAMLEAVQTADGWVLDGFEPYVSGWGRIDNVHVAARGPNETVVHVAIDAEERNGLRVTRHDLAAVNASGTVRMEFDAVPVPESRVLGVAAYAPGDNPSPFNGFLALGVARRCCRLLDLPAFDEELDRRRADLHGAMDGGVDVAGARARASDFALRAAGAVVVRVGSSAVLTDHHAQRLLREAMFVLIFATSPSTKQALLSGFRRQDS